MLLGRIDRHMHEWSLIPVGGTGRVVSTPNRRVDQCSGRTNLPWLLPGPVLWTVPHEALIGLDPASTSPTLKTTFAKVWQPQPSRLEYLKRRCLLRRRQASFISTSMVGVTFDQDAGRVDSAPGRLLSLALRPGIAIVIVPNGQVLIEGRVVSTPNRRIIQHTHHSNSSWLPSGSVFWTIPYKALIDRTQTCTQIALTPASTKAWLSRQSRMEYHKCRCLLRRRQFRLILASTVGVTFDQSAGRVDSAPGRSLSFALCHETATVVIPNGQVFTMGRVLSTSYRQVGSQLLHSEITLQTYKLHAQSYGGTHIWISLQYAAHSQVPHTTKRHRRIDKQSRCLNGSCSAVAGHVETSKFSRWQQIPSNGEMGSQPRSLDITIISKDNGARLITAATTTLPIEVHRELDMTRNPLPGTPINLPVVKAGPETHPPRTAVSAPRGPIPGTPINLPVRRDSTIRPANTDLDTVEEGAGLSQGSPDSLDRALDEASDRDIDSAEFSVLWPSASEDEADRRSPRPQHSAASSSQQVAQQVTAGEHGAEAGLRSPLPGWSEASDTLQEAWDGTNPHHTPDDTRMHDKGLRSPRLAPDGAKSSSKRSRHVAKMLVRSGLRCHCCFKLKHECEHRKADILLANYRTFSCKSPLSLGLLLSFLFCPGSPGPGQWWLKFEPPYSRHSTLATPGIFGHGYTYVKCEAGAGKVVSTPGGSPAPPPVSISAFRQPEHGRNQQASQVKQHGRSPPGQLGPHVCPHAVRSLAAIAYTQLTACTWEPVFDSRQNFQAEPCQRPVRTRRGTSRWTTSRLYPWCPSPRSRSHQWKGGRRRSRSRNNPMRSQNHRPRSPGSMLMGQPVRGFQDRQAPLRETAPLGVQQCGRRSQDSSSLDFMVARTPSSELFRHGLAVSAPWIFATAPKLQNDCESSAWKSLHRQPPIILASAIRPYTMPGQVPPGRATNIHSRGKVVSTPGLDPRVPCMQLSPSFRLMRSFDLPTLHDQNISHYREVLARHGTQQHSWFCYTVRVGLTATPAHTSGIPSPPPSGSSILRVQFSSAWPWYLARRRSGSPRDGSHLT